MLLIQTVIVTLRYQSDRDYYESKGYKVEGVKKLEVSVWDLPPKSHMKVKIQCDYCEGEPNIVEREWHRFLKGREKIDKDACFDCRIKKEKEICMKEYGVQSKLALKETQEKIKKTIEERYNGSPMRDPKILQKMKNTMVERYGADNAQKVPEFKEKTKETNLEKYGVENILCAGEFRNSFYYKTIETKSVNGTFPVSKPQDYLSKLYNALCNQMIAKYYVVDLLFENTNIYCEYDGGGHRVNVLIGQITNEEFERKEQKRYFAIKKEGYKLFRIVNETHKRRDKLPSDEVLLKIKEVAFYILQNTENNFITFNFDNKFIELKNNKIECNFDENTEALKILNNFMKNIE